MPARFHSQSPQACHVRAAYARLGVAIGHAHECVRDGGAVSVGTAHRRMEENVCRRRRLWYKQQLGQALGENAWATILDPGGEKERLAHSSIIKNCSFLFTTITWITKDTWHQLYSFRIASYSFWRAVERQKSFVSSLCWSPPFAFFLAQRVFCTPSLVRNVWRAQMSGTCRAIFKSSAAYLSSSCRLALFFEKCQLIESHGRRSALKYELIHTDLPTRRFRSSWRNNWLALKKVARKLLTSISSQDWKLCDVEMMDSTALFSTDGFSFVAQRSMFVTFPLLPSLHLSPPLPSSSAHPCAMTKYIRAWFERYAREEDSVFHSEKITATEVVTLLWSDRQQP